MQKNKNYLKVLVIIFFSFFPPTYLYLTVPLHEASYEIQKPFPVVHSPLGHVEPRDRACICFPSEWCEPASSGGPWGYAESRYILSQCLHLGTPPTGMCSFRASKFLWSVFLALASGWWVIFSPDPWWWWWGWWWWWWQQWFFKLSPTGCWHVSPGLNRENWFTYCLAGSWNMASCPRLSAKFRSFWKFCSFLHYKIWI